MGFIFGGEDTGLVGEVVIFEGEVFDIGDVVDEGFGYGGPHIEAEGMDDVVELDGVEGREFMAGPPQAESFWVDLAQEVLTGSFSLVEGFGDSDDSFPGVWEAGEGIGLVLLFTSGVSSVEEEADEGNGSYDGESGGDTDDGGWD